MERDSKRFKVYNSKTGRLIYNVPDSSQSKSSSNMGTAV